MTYRVLHFTPKTPVGDIEKFVRAGITEDTPFEDKPGWGREEGTGALAIFYLAKGEQTYIEHGEYVAMRGNKVEHVLGGEELRDLHLLMAAVAEVMK